MEATTDLARAWPWYVTGPLLGLAVPALLLAGNRLFGVSTAFRHVCAAFARRPAPYFRYDWRGDGVWNLAFAGGIIVGGWLAATWLSGGADLAIAAATVRDLRGLGLETFGGLAPERLFSLAALASPEGAVAVLGGGFLVGFGAAWAGGCTSGHAITGLAELRLSSLVAVLGFFAGGLLATWVLLPLVLA